MLKCKIVELVNCNPPFKMDLLNIFSRLLLSFEKHVVRSNVASKGVLPASQMNKLRKMNMAVVHRWPRKPSTATSSKTAQKSEDAAGTSEVQNLPIFFLI